jgi:hypothetical protein
VSARKRFIGFIVDVSGAFHSKKFGNGVMLPDFSRNVNVILTHPVDLGRISGKYLIMGHNAVWL